MATVTDRLLTIEEFVNLPDPGYPTELVRGRVITLTNSDARHGWRCNRIICLLNHFTDLGRSFCKDDPTGVITSRNPDSLRRADVSYYSYARVPQSASMGGYCPVPPDLVFEVQSPSDRRPRLLAKVAEYLEVGVVLVTVIDPERRQIRLYWSDQPDQILGDGDTWSAPEILPGLIIPFRSFFE